ncbi:hypothetical protein WJ973_23775 [Achromobacter xylosoxidans]
MPVYINTDFRGHWPVGTAAVVAADSAEHAAQQLEAALSRRGLPQPVEAADMRLFLDEYEAVEILCDGDY